MDDGLNGWRDMLPARTLCRHRHKGLRNTVGTAEGKRLLKWLAYHQGRLSVKNKVYWMNIIISRSLLAAGVLVPHLASQSTCKFKCLKCFANLPRTSLSWDAVGMKTCLSLKPAEIATDWPQDSAPVLNVHQATDAKIMLLERVWSW